VLHHQAFARAGLNTPHSIVVNSSDRDGGAVDAAMVRSAAEALIKQGACFPLLVKPNAAGFGAGIVVLESFEAIDAHFVTPQVVSNDGIALVQERLLDPTTPAFYRVWFLDQRVQCGVELTRAGLGVTGGCVGGVCARSSAAVVKDTFRAWEVPESVCEAVIRVAAIAQASCGSVELLYVDGKPVYFDLNMLSTLPTPGVGVEDPHGVWLEGFEPRAAHADYVASLADQQLKL
jgi:hypothetical protein